MIHTSSGIDLDDLKLLCLGKIQWRKCQVCDADGRQYWDNNTGEGVSHTPSGIDPRYLEVGACETCLGLGFVLYHV